MSNTELIIGKIQEAKGIVFPEEQVNVITHAGSPAYVISCAGSGKSTLMEAKIAYEHLSRGVDVREFCVISFSKFAVERLVEGYKNLSTKLGFYDEDYMPTFKTFHALYYMILKYYWKALYKDSPDEIPEVLDSGQDMSLFNTAFYSKSKNKDDITKERILSLRSYAVNNLITSKEALFNSSEFILSNVDKDDYSEVTSEYRRLKSEQNKIDFEDMQIEMFKLVRMVNIKDERDKAIREKILNMIRGAWNYWIVDEYQDSCKIQVEILKIIVKDPSKLLVIGDEDQSIYGFRGSKAEYILDFPLHFVGAKQYKIGTNYRCPQKILDVMGRVIANNQERVQKGMKSFSDGGQVHFNPVEDSIETATKVAEKIKELFLNNYPLEKIVVLVRNTKQQLFVVDKLLDSSIPLKVVRASNLIYNNPVTKDVIGIIEMALNPNDPELFKKYISRLTKYFSNRDIGKIVDRMYNEDSYVEWYDFAEDCNDSVLNAIEILKDVAGYIEGKEKISDILDLFSTEYKLFLEYSREKSEINYDDSVKIFNYLKILGADKTYKVFKYYLKKAESLLEGHCDDVVTVTTMHSVKGLQYGKVFLIDIDEDEFPNSERIKVLQERFGLEEASHYVEEERRVFYVAGTRAEEELYIYYNKYNPSTFVVESFMGIENEIREQGLELNLSTGGTYK